MQLCNKVAIILGVFEFVACYEIWVKDEHSNALLPDDFFVLHGKSGRLVWMAYITTLGLQRLTWSFGKYRYGDGNYPMFSAMAGYLCLVLTHVVEAVLWWQLALSPHFNTGINNLSNATDTATTTTTDTYNYNNHNNHNHHHNRTSTVAHIILSCLDLSVKGGAQTSILLLGVPVLTMFFILTAFPKRKSHAKTE